MKKSVCLNCSQALRRVHRKRWMQLIPFSRYYFCKNCNTKFFRIGNTFIYQKDEKNKVSYLFKKMKPAPQLQLTIDN